jgi:hypothetical protein
MLRFWPLWLRGRVWDGERFCAARTSVSRSPYGQMGKLQLPVRVTAKNREAKKRVLKQSHVLRWDWGVERQ